MYKEIDSNKRKTIILFAVFIALIAVIGGVAVIFSEDIRTFYFVFGLGIVYAVFQYYFASKIALAVSGAKPLERKQNPYFYNIVENLSITMGLPMPKVYIIDDPAPNAFATGRNPDHASVAATTGLIEIMDKRELTAVMAHEMAHVKNFDIRVSMIAFGLTAAICFISDLIIRMAFYGNDRKRSKENQILMILGLIAAILMPIVAMFIQMAVSRKREFLADSTAGLMLHDPEAMALALEKLANNPQKMRHHNSAMDNMYINNPAPKKANFFTKMTSTHPPIQDRIAKLRSNKHF